MSNSNDVVKFKKKEQDFVCRELRFWDDLKIQLSKTSEQFKIYTILKALDERLNIETCGGNAFENFILEYKKHIEEKLVNSILEESYDCIDKYVTIIRIINENYSWNYS